MLICLGNFEIFQVIEEPPKEETKKVGVRFAPEPEMEDIQTKTEVSSFNLNWLHCFGFTCNQNSEIYR